VNTPQVHLNIHCRLNEPLRQQVINYNAVFSAAIPSEIRFFGEAPAEPHITLLMGRVRPGGTLEEVLAILREVLSAERTFAFHTGSLRIVGPKGQFIFLDLKDDREFRRLKRMLYDVLAPVIDFDHHGGPDNKAHITIAYANRTVAELPKTSVLPSHQQSEVHAIGVSYVGKRGTCMSEIAEIRLASH
jgi:hypothetical protein